MESQWTDETEILHDLSLAQGHWVPCEIDVIAAGVKPPSVVIAEETEEDYYHHWTTEGDFNTGPDLTLIKKMLEMVHDEPENEDSCTAPSAHIVITKVNPVPLPMMRKPQAKKGHKTKEKPIMPRRARNVAIASILASKQTASAPEVPLKLSKPEDFIKTKEKPLNKEESYAKERKQQSVKKVNHWLNMQQMNNMFKKKSPTKAANEHKITDGQNNQRKEKVSSPAGDNYKPSSWAGEYYQTCIKRSQMQQLIKESVWDHAVKVMKNIDDRKAEEMRKQQDVDDALAAVLEAAEAEIISKEVTQNEENCDKQEDGTKRFTAIEKIELSEHRHQLAGACIVCEVLLKEPLENHTADAIISEAENTYITHESEQSSPEVFHAIESNSGLNETYHIGNESDGDAELYGLVRATFVENLANIDTAELNCFLNNPGSLEELDVFA